MRPYTSNNPVFSEAIQITETTDPAHADNINAAPKQLLENTLANRKSIDSLEEKVGSTMLVTLATDGWTGSEPPYIQTINVPGAGAGMEALLVSALEDGAGADAQKAYSKAFGIVSSGTASLGDGTATFKAYKIPTTDITVGLRGLM